MRRTLMFLSAVLMSTTLSAQIKTDCLGPFGFKLPFNCKPLYLLEALNNTILPTCIDSITVCLGLPMPPRAEPSVVATPAYLVRDNGFGPKPYDTLKCDMRLDSELGTLTIYPRTPLPVMDDDLANPVEYLILVNCEYWKDEGTGTQEQRFIKQYVVKAVSEARSTVDSSIVAGVYTDPPRRSPVHLIWDGINLFATEENDSVVFDYWTISHPEITIDPKRREQHVATECWPLADTVLFTAWYRPVTSTVKEPAGGEQNIECSILPEQIRVTAFGEPITDVFVVDLLGRIERQVRPLPSSMQVDLTQPDQRGVYVVVVKTARTTRTFTFTN